MAGPLVVTGATIASDDLVNIWSHRRSYVPDDGAFGGPDSSPWFEYVDVGDSAQRRYQVVAYNASGDAPASVVVCASPPQGAPRRATAVERAGWAPIMVVSA